MFVCMSNEHCERVANFHAWSGKMPRHDSRAPWLRPVRHYPHLLDIDPGPQVEWDFNPPETYAARHTVRAAKTEELKKVQKYL